MELTDRTDDFDFVTAEQSTRSGIYENVSFTALDGTTRTDTWVANAEESEAGTDLWDPDTDDDGLTDGQELKWVTTAEQPVGSIQQIERSSLGDRGVLGTSAKTPDSDGDGYWDGWIGVYGVERTENVVLYREHLQTGDGIEGDEIVQQQVGVHEISDASSVSGVDIDDDGDIEHSNLYVGELQWKTDPAAGDEIPDTSLSIEVDFYDSPRAQSLNTKEWELGIENNFKLYGIGVDLVRDETLADEDVRGCTVVSSVSGLVCTDPSNGFSTIEVGATFVRQSDEPTEEYLFVTNQPQPDGVLDNSTWGVNLFGFPTQAIYADQIYTQRAGGIDESLVTDSAYESKLGLVTAAVEMHEIGHSFGAGRADDRFELSEPTTVLNNNEVYSGSSDDLTPERYERNGIKIWSLMRRGWGPNSLFETETRTYYVFSVEELSTIEK
jgi:hypothetical protein